MEDSQHFDAVSAKLMNETPKIKDAAKNLLSEQMAKLDNRFDAPQFLAAMQKILKAIKNVELLDPMEWANRNPQKETELGMERIEQIVAYKASYALWKRAKSAGASPSALLGRSFLSIVWPQVKQQVETNEEVDDVLGLILAAFESSLESKSNLDVVWCLNISETVALRHKERKVLAEERLRQRAENETKVPIADDLTPGDPLANESA